MNQIGWIVGLATCVAGALIGQSDLIGEPWKHYVTIAFVAGTAATGYMLQKPAPTWDGTERRKEERV
jgi:hypothetical protein